MPKPPIDDDRKQQIAAALSRAGLLPGQGARAGGLRFTPGSFDLERLSARFVASTELPALVWDWERWDFVMEVLRADGMILPAAGQVPLLDSHSRSSVDDVLGSASDFKDLSVDGQSGKDCEVVFSAAGRGPNAAAKVREGHVTDVSVGYAVTEAYWIPEGEKGIVGGREYAGPLKVTTKWELRELSLVPIGADRLAKVRAQFAMEHHNSNKENEMDKELRKLLEARGLAVDATEEQAQAFLQRALAAGNDDAVRQAAEKAVQEERARVTAIDAAVTAAGLGADFARELATKGVSIETAREQIILKLSAANPPLGAGAGITHGADSRDKFRAAAGDGLLLRAGVAVEKPAPGAGDFRGLSLLEIAREALELAGVSTRGMSRNQVAGRAIAAASSSDFPLIMSNVVGKRLIAAYNEWPATWRPFVATTDATDFKDLHSLQLSGSPDLLPTDEHGEYRTASFSEKGETYRVVTKGRVVALTRTMIINDDLRALARIPFLFGSAARRMEGDAVWSLIVSNPQLADGKALFHADHRNLETAAALKAPVSTDGLSAARTAMRRQKGMAGERIDVVPAFLLVPTVQETVAEVILRSAALPKADMSAGVHNPWAGKLTPIADPRLDDASDTAWYLLGHPAQAPVIEVAWLEGQQQPYVEEELDFDSDALKIKVRHDFGAGLVDFVGAFKNPGA